MKPHKHAKLIHAYADGAVIQYRNKTTDMEWKTFIVGPSWLDDTEYRASLAEVEGKPVFEGDVLYYEGTVVRADIIAKDNINGSLLAKGGGLWSIDKLSWNPPLPKTVTIELLREDVERVLHCLDMYEVPVAITRAKEAVKAALKEKP